MFRVLAGVVLVFFLVGCSEGFVSFPVTREAQSSVSGNVEIVRLDAGNIASFTSPRRGHVASSIPAGRGWNYRVGVGDILNVIVFDHPELTLPAGSERSAEESGFRVQADGTFFYPFIGQVRAAGRPPEQIRAEVTARLAEYIPDPQVEVRVAAFNSQNVVVAGEVETPNRQPLTTVPLTLVAAVNAAGGLTEAGDPRHITVQRGHRRYRVDLGGFLNAGLRDNNPVLQDGDVVNVPRRRAQEAYLLGELVEPGVIDLSLEPVTLTQAVARKGGLDEVRADARGIFVFRRRDGAAQAAEAPAAGAAGRSERVTVFQLETTSPAGMLLGTRFVLEPGDVVYVVRAPLTRWNDTINVLLPTVLAGSQFDDLLDGDG